MPVIPPPVVSVDPVPLPPAVPALPVSSDDVEDDEDEDDEDCGMDIDKDDSDDISPPLMVPVPFFVRPRDCGCPSQPCLCFWTI